MAGGGVRQGSSVGRGAWVWVWLETPRVRRGCAPAGRRRVRRWGLGAQADPRKPALRMLWRRRSDLFEAGFHGSLGLLDDGHLALDLGDDAVLFGEGWERDRHLKNWAVLMPFVQHRGPTLLDARRQPCG